MMENGPCRAVRSKAEWVAILEDQERSSKSAARFCREQAICYHQFIYRRKALKKKSRSLAMSGSPCGVPVSGFIPIRVEEGAGVRLRFPGLVLEIDRVPSAAWVVEVARRWAGGEGSPC